MKRTVPGFHLFILLVICAAVSLTTVRAQSSAQAQKQPAASGVNLTANSANVSEPGIPIRIDILRWSTDEERTPLAAALTPPPAADPLPPLAAVSEQGGTAPAAPGGQAQGGRGGAGGGARGGRGGGGGGRGGGGGAAAASADPITNLTTAIGRAPTVGYIWTNEVVGYSIKYAYHAQLPDGGERIILTTDRRLGGFSTALKPVATAGTPTNYEFTVLEIRLDPKGLGEGKTSLTTKVVLDNQAKAPALENYAAATAILQSVKR